MREYDKMTLKIADRIFENGDRILEQRREKAAKIRHITYVASGMCAVLIVCFGAWKLFPSLKPDNNFKDVDIIITTSTTAAETATENTTNIECCSAFYHIGMNCTILIYPDTKAVSA